MFSILVTEFSGQNSTSYIPHTSAMGHYLHSGFVTIRFWVPNPFCIPTNLTRNIHVFLKPSWQVVIFHFKAELISLLLPLLQIIN